MIDTPYESNISSAVEEDLSSENIYSGIAFSNNVLKYHQTLLKPSNKLNLLKKYDSIMNKN